MLNDVKKMMRKSWILFLLLLWGTMLYADTKLASTAALTQVTKEWIELNRQINDEVIRWNEDKQVLNNIRELLLKEIEENNEILKKSEQTKRGYNKERLQLLEQKKSFEKIIADCMPIIDEAEKRIMFFRSKIPLPFFGDYDQLFFQVEKGSQQSLSRRLQRLLTIYARIEHDQSVIHLVRQELEVKPGQSMECDVLYFGFAQALAVSADNTASGIAKPQVSGWEWIWDASHVLSVRLAIDYYQHKKIAAFTDLPIKLESKP